MVIWLVHISRMWPKPDFVAPLKQSSEYLGADKIAPWRCPNVTVILTSFAGHTSWPPEADTGSEVRTRRFNRWRVRAAERRRSSMRIGSEAETPLLSPAVGFSKRSVVAWRRRSVACALGRSPKEVLFKAFKNSRRAARTAKFKRRSWRLARTQVISLASVFEVQMASSKSSWRPLGSCVADVLRQSVEKSSTATRKVSIK